MITQISDILSIVDFGQPCDYKTWKNHRPEIISNVGPKIFELSEENLNSTFDGWEKAIRSAATIDRTKTQMNVLMAFSILSHFQDDVDQIKNMISIVTNLLSHKIPDVSCAASKVLYWIALEINDGGLIFKESINSAFTWIDEKPKLAFNALSLLKRTKKFASKLVVNTVLRKFPTFFNFMTGDDPRLRILSARVIVQQIQHLEVQKSLNHVSAPFLSCINYVTQNTGQQSQGPLIVLKALLPLYPHLFVPHIERLMKAVIDFSKSGFDDLALDAFRLALEVAKTNKFEITKASQTMLFSNLKTKCLKSPNFAPFFKVLDTYIRFFKPHDILPSLIEFVQKTLLSPSARRLTTNGLFILSTLFELFPDAKINPASLTDVYPCDNYIKCLKMRINLLNYIRNYLNSVMTRGLSIKAPTNSILLSLKLAQAFPLNLFEKSTKIFQQIKPLLACTQETVKIELMKTFATIKSQEALEIILYEALYDPYKHVRLASVEALEPCDEVALHKNILSLLYDPSFKVRRKGLNLISQLSKTNPFDFNPPLIQYVQFVLNAVRSVPDIKTSAKFASLLPLIASSLSDTIDPLIPNMISLCLNFLCGEEADNKIDIIECDDFRDKNSFLSDIENKKKTEPKRYRVFTIINQQYFDQRDAHLLDTLAALGELVSPYLPRVFNAFYRVFTTRQSPDLLAAAANALARLATEIGTGLNLRIKYPQLLPVLMKLLSSRRGKIVSVAILKLLGAAFDGGSLYDTSDVEASETDCCGNMNSPSFFTDFCMSHLIPYFDQPSMPLFEATAQIFDASPDASKFASKVIPAFINGIETVNDKQRDLLFKDLISITCRCKNETIAFLPQLTSLAIKYINVVSCIKLCSSLSYNLMGSFSPFVKSLYFQALQRMATTNDVEYFKELQRFIVFAITYQSQPFELFISSLEKMFAMKTTIPQKFIAYICESLTCLVQNTDLVMFQSRIMLLTNQIIHIIDDKSLVNNLLYSEVACTGLPLAVIERWMKSMGLVIPRFQELKNNVRPNSTMSIREIFFAKQTFPSVPEFHLRIPTEESLNEVFTVLQDPDELNIGKWLDELSERVIKYSPSPVIRSCGKVVNLISTFRQQLFPIAFLSCWLKADYAQKKHFSAIAANVITHHAQVDPFFSQIAEILDRVRQPLLLNDEVITKCCESRPLKLFFQQRLYRDNPTDPQIVDALMRLNTSMGRNSSARGLLIDAKDYLAPESAGKWSEMLGEWETALDIYKQKNEEDPNLITVYSNLEQWKNVIDLEPVFKVMNREDQQHNAAYFALAFFQTGNLRRAEQYMSFFPPELSLNEIFFKSIFFVSTGKLDQAEQIINKGLSVLANDTTAYSSGDAYRVNGNITYAQVFVELQEAIDIKRKYSTKVFDPQLAALTWSKRLKGFKRDSDNWIKLIRVRSLVFDPDQSISVYLKMISVLRKERCWKLIDTYFDRIFGESTIPKVEFAQSKIFWARGRKSDAISTLKYLVDIFEMNDPSSFIDALEKTKPTKASSIFASFIKQKLISREITAIIGKHLGKEGKFDVAETIKNLSCEEQLNLLKEIAKEKPEKLHEMFEHAYSLHSIEDGFKSNVYRFLANDITLTDNPSNEQLNEAVDLLERALNLNPENFKTCLDWAYANARLIATNSDKTAHSINAVRGFLKATQLAKSGSLEFLCQMFSIFFQMDDSMLSDTTLLEEILNLQPTIIDQVIPQITVQISHSVEIIRKTVHEIIFRFGKQHYQAIFFPLKLYDNCQNVEKSEIAHEILSKLSMDHVEESKDSELFADGMLRSAISWFEEWMTSIDNASRADHEHNTAKMDAILNRMFTKYQNPKGELDRWFIRLHDTLIKQAYRGFKTHTPESLKFMWDTFKHLFIQLTERVKKLDFILLTKVSQELAMKNGFSIAIPGTYQITHPVPKLERIETALQVMSTQQHPRCVLMVDSTGEKVKFLLKGNEDLRLDQRIMQFFILINYLLNTGRAKREVPAQIVKYAIIPLAPTAGLISWVTGADTMHQMICEMRMMKQISLSVEIEVLSQNVGNAYQTCNKLQMFELFGKVAKVSPANEIRDILWMKAPNAAGWLLRNRNFTITNALMSMVGYIIGLGDRHPSNIMVQRDTGKVIHIDFGDSFETTVLRPNYPEKVPFRLTRMIVNALDNGSVEGMFRRACEDVMYMLRDNMSPLVAQLEIFIHEPLDEEEADNKDSKSHHIVDRVTSKLKGRDSLYHDLLIDGEPELSVEDQVSSLIRIATDPSRYVTHYGGWCPFW